MSDCDFKVILSNLYYHMELRLRSLSSWFSSSIRMGRFNLRLIFEFLNLFIKKNTDKKAVKYSLIYLIKRIFK